MIGFTTSRRTVFTPCTGNNGAGRHRRPHRAFSPLRTGEQRKPIGALSRRPLLTPARRGTTDQVLRLGQCPASHPCVQGCNFAFSDYVSHV